MAWSVSMWVSGFVCGHRNKQFDWIRRLFSDAFMPYTKI